MADDSMRTVLVALGAGIGVTLAKVGAAALTGSTALAAEAAHSLADNANDLSFFIAQRRSSRPPDDQHPLGYGPEAYFWALIAGLGVFVAGAAFSLRDGITELIHPQRHLLVRRGLRRAGHLHRPGPDVHPPVRGPDEPPGPPLPAGAIGGVPGHL
jgi:divalent metal cation (Fe/Co/Zn/Cd) transporter